MKLINRSDLGLYEETIPPSPKAEKQPSLPKVQISPISLFGVIWSD